MLVGLYEWLHLIDPTGSGHEAGLQKQKPGATGNVGGCPQPCSAASRQCQHATAGSVRDLFGGVARTCIGNDHFAHSSGHCAGYESGQGRQ